MKKIISLFVSIICIFCSLLPTTVFADSPVKVLNSVQEITDIDELISRAENHMDDLFYNTGYYGTIEIINNSRESSSITKCNTEMVNVTHAETSQLLRSVLINGERVDDYVAVALSTYESNPHSASVSGITLISKIYLSVRYNGNRVEISLRSTSSQVLGTAQRLVMTNLVQEFTGGAQYSNGRTVNYPSGIYTLSAPSGAVDVWLTDATAFCQLSDTIYTSTGASCNVRFLINHNLNEYS